MLPEELQKLQNDFPGIEISESPLPDIHKLSGQAVALEHGACLLYALGELLWVKDKKFRVTIECDPEAQRFIAVREDL